MQKQYTEQKYERKPIKKKLKTKKKTSRSFHFEQIKHLYNILGLTRQSRSFTTLVDSFVHQTGA